MPKETIKNPTPLAVGEIRFDMTVGWQRDCDVQVGIVTGNKGDGQYHLVDQVYGGAVAEIGLAVRRHRDAITATTPDSKTVSDEALGRIVLNAVTGSTPFGEGVYWHPSRAQINDLIRTLRKARDAAFGSDA